MVGPRVLGGTEGSRTFRATFAVSVREINALHCFVLTGSNTRQLTIRFNWEKLSPVSNLKTEQRDKIQKLHTLFCDVSPLSISVCILI